MIWNSSSTVPPMTGRFELWIPVTWISFCSLCFCCF
jgi:hypothetical protein